MRYLTAPALCLVLAACAGGPPPRMVAPPPSPYEGQEAPPGQPAQPYKPPPPPPVKSAGPLGAANVESYMDQQERELRGLLRGSGIALARQGDTLAMHLKSDEMFDGNSLRLSERALRLLAGIAPVLRRYDRTTIFIDAYTDTTGSPEKNEEISRKRAYTIGGQLVKNAVPLSRLQAKGYGETDLKFKTGDSVNEPRNRRIELRIVPKL